MHSVLICNDGCISHPAALLTTQPLSPTWPERHGTLANIHACTAGQAAPPASSHSQLTSQGPATVQSSALCRRPPAQIAGVQRPCRAAHCAGGNVRSSSMRARSPSLAVATHTYRFGPAAAAATPGAGRSQRLQLGGRVRRARVGRHALEAPGHARRAGRNDERLRAAPRAAREDAGRLQQVAAGVAVEEAVRLQPEGQPARPGRAPPVSAAAAAPAWGSTACRRTSVQRSASQRARCGGGTRHPPRMCAGCSRP
jgi:hypothetical protein